MRVAGRTLHAACSRSAAAIRPGACRMSHVACCTLHSACSRSAAAIRPGACCMLHVACCMLHASCVAPRDRLGLARSARREADFGVPARIVHLHVACRMLHVARCMFHVACCMLHVAVACCAFFGLGYFACRMHARTRMHVRMRTHAQRTRTHGTHTYR